MSEGSRNLAGTSGGRVRVPMEREVLKSPRGENNLSPRRTKRQKSGWSRTAASAFRGKDQRQGTSKATREGEEIAGSFRSPRSRGGR